MDLQHTMGQRSILFVMISLLYGAAATSKIQAHFNETAILPCQFTNPQNISPSELVIFLQDQEKSVLYELYLGKRIFKNVASKYKDRHLSFDKESWTLYLHDVEIKDQATYQCFIYHKSSNRHILINQMSSELSVFANFSQPEIIPDSNSSDTSYVNLTCSSTQGYPPPKEMYFLVKNSTDNSTSKYSATMHPFQDNVTELYRVSISLYYTRPDNTMSASILCVLCPTDALPVQPGLQKTCLHSKPYLIVSKKKEPRLSQNDYIIWVATAAVLLLLIVGLVGFLIQWKKKKKKKPDHSRECNP